ncbi:umecyanin-like [Syzygium oleosum]|uniref:umecyanin-like n=1 Tax=Syzygium oleosum TaxID=219896 RepID=UPI0024BAC7E0|nr:umecyanin-like [Syzygium oleosum]XP_056162503.1 umecyanin-like [Syzygium oleosum]
MEMATRVNLTAWLIMVISAGFIHAAAAATTYTVGDELGWTVPSNISYYQSWAASKTFMVGDQLSFNWTGTHNVAEVSKAEYDNCTQVVSVMGSPVNIKLLKGGSYHYICTVDSHCELGQKLSITVGSSAAAPASPSNSAPSTPLDSSVLVSACITIAYCVIILASELNVVHYIG